MISFRKKSQEELDFEEENDFSRDKRKKLTKKLTSTKRKKEPVKPWGKKERFLVFFVLFITIVISGALSLQARSWKLPGIPRLKVPSFSIPFFKEKTIIIEGNDKDEQKSQEIIDKFKQETADLSGVYGLYVVRLKNGSSFGVFENEVFQAASLIKLPVMVSMYIEAEKGDLDLNTKYSLKASDKIAGSGSLYSKPAGYTLTYRDLVRLMGKQSDNTAFNIAKNLLGDEKIEEAMTKIGMTQTSPENNETTPYDVGSFFENLERGNIVSEKSKNELIAFLTDTIYESHLRAGIPQDIQVAHKYGREVHVVNDAGIVFASSPEGDEPFVIVIMSKGVVEKEADEIFPELTRAIYELEVK